MKTYRCTHLVEAALWTDTDENREAFATWFESHGHEFQTRGPVIVHYCDHDGSSEEWPEGMWILWSHNEFIAMGAEEFAEYYMEHAS